MTTSTPSPARKGGSPRAFTLVEVLVSAGLMGFILMGILTTFLFLGRSSASIVSYSEMETEARKGLELFAVDTRQASAVNWISPVSIALTVDGVSITYAYSAANKTFSRSVAGVSRVLVSNVTSFELRGYKVNSTVALDTSTLDTADAIALVNNDTKQVQISMKAQRVKSTVVGATNSVFSARYILRNKKVTI